MTGYHALPPAPGALASESMTKDTARPRRCILVLGVRGSGSPALAGVLEHLGVDIPASCRGAEPPHPDQRCESPRLHRLHDAVLAAAGTSWDDWQGFDPGWHATPAAAALREQALEILAQEFGASRLFVLTDPRLCRLVPFWTAVLAGAGIRPAVLHIHRSPAEVAAALQQAGGIDPDYAPLLWLRHVLEAEGQSRDLPRQFTSLGRFLEEWPRIIAAAQDGMQLHWPRFSQQVADDIEAFLAPGPRRRPVARAQAADPLPPGWLHDTFGILERWSTSGENPADHARLDALRAELDATGPAFGPLVLKGRDATRQTAASAGALQEAQQAVAALSARLADLTAAHAGAEAALRDATEARQAESIVSRTEITRLRDRLAQMEQPRAGGTATP
jgi:hypothetical protein